MKCYVASFHIHSTPFCCSFSVRLFVFVSFYFVGAFFVFFVCFCFVFLLFVSVCSLQIQTLGLKLKSASWNEQDMVIVDGTQVDSILFVIVCCACCSVLLILLCVLSVCCYCAVYCSRVVSCCSSVEVEVCELE